MVEDSNVISIKWRVQWRLTIIVGWVGFFYGMLLVARTSEDWSALTRRGAPELGFRPAYFELLSWFCESSLHSALKTNRSEALSHGRGEAFTQPQEVFDTAPSAFRLHVPPAEPDAAVPIRLIGIVNPLSTTAQSASALFALVGMAFNAEVSLVLNPVMSYSEYPLKRYYREVIQWLLMCLLSLCVVCVVVSLVL